MPAPRSSAIGETGRAGSAPVCLVTAWLLGVAGCDTVAVSEPTPGLPDTSGLEKLSSPDLAVQAERGSDGLIEIEVEAKDAFDRRSPAGYQAAYEVIVTFDPHVARFASVTSSQGSLVVLDDRQAGAGSLRLIAADTLQGRAPEFALSFEIVSEDLPTGLRVSRAGPPEESTASTLTSVASGEVTASASGLALDCSPDGRVDARDVSKAADFAIGVVAPPQETGEIGACDPDANGLIDVIDVRALAVEAFTWAAEFKCAFDPPGCMEFRWPSSISRGGIVQAVHGSVESVAGQMIDHTPGVFVRATWRGSDTNGIDINLPQAATRRPRELWVETEIRFNGSSWAETSDDKTLFVLEDWRDVPYDSTSSLRAQETHGADEVWRWAVFLRGRNGPFYGGPGGGPVDFGLAQFDASPRTVFDGEWHRVRLHFRMSSDERAPDGAYQVWLDESLVSDRSDLRTETAPEAFFRVVALGRNADPDPGSSRDWGRLRVWSANPGWN